MTDCRQQCTAVIAICRAFDMVSVHQTSLQADECPQDRLINDKQVTV